jgi:hypothetical protein
MVSANATSTPFGCRSHRRLETLREAATNLRDLMSPTCTRDALEVEACEFIARERR